MPVSGLVVSLTDQPALRQQAIDAMGQEPRIEVGMIKQQRMSVVMDTSSSDEDKELWTWLTGLPGVVFVDVVMVGFENEATTELQPVVAKPAGPCVNPNE